MQREFVQVLVAPHEFAERTRREQRLGGVHRSALVDVDEASPQRLSPTIDLLLRALQRAAGRVDVGVDREELRVERAHEARRRLGLPVQVLRLVGDVVRLSLERLEARLELGALAADRFQLLALLAQPLLRVLGACDRLGTANSTPVSSNAIPRAPARMRVTAPGGSGARPRPRSPPRRSARRRAARGAPAVHRRTRSG